MSIRERVEEALAHRILERDGMAAHFSHGDPVVCFTHPDGNEYGAPLLDGERIWADAKARAAETYRAVVDAVDWSRLVVEAGGAYLAMGDEHDLTALGSDPKDAGRALKAAMLTERTFPDWPAEIADLTERGLLR